LREKNDGISPDKGRAAGTAVVIKQAIGIILIFEKIMGPKITMGNLALNG
jgi:hypothetical protein